MPSYLSLVILSYQNWPTTERCLRSLLSSIEQQYVNLGTEIIIVDNGSDENVRIKLKAFQHTNTNKGIQIRTVFLEENLGYPSGINLGIAEARGDVIGVLNNDLVFPEGWLKPLVDAVEDDKLVAFAAPHLSTATSIQSVQASFANDAEMAVFAKEFMEGHIQQYIYTDRVIGACLVFRRDFLSTVGGNDFWYGIGNYDDDDWCLRALVAGYKIVVVGGSFVHHVGHAAFNLHGEEFKSSLDNNVLKFEKKWDIRERANASGSFSRSGSIKHTRFNRSVHFVPIRLREYSLAEKPFFPRDYTLKRVLLCADWTSNLSSWRRSLTSWLRQTQQAELCLWIPESYFDVNIVLREIEAVFEESSSSHSGKGIKITLFQVSVPSVDTLRVLKSADEILSVANDFVNRYLMHLANQINMPAVQLDDR